MFKFRKREKFVVISFLLGLVLWMIQYAPLGGWLYGSIVCFSILTYFFGAWALSDDLQLTEWFTILPFFSMYSLSVGLFYFLIPAHLFSRIFTTFSFSIGMYFLFLMGNIYSVAKERTIQLISAAHSTQIFFSALISLFFLNTLLSFQLSFYQNAVIIFLIHFWLSFFCLWAQELDLKIDFRLWQLSFLISLLVMQLGIILDFIPFPIWHKALFMMTFFYVLINLVQQYLKHRLFKKTFREYYLVIGFILILFIYLFPSK
jgi:hypothetical protein